MSINKNFYTLLAILNFFKLVLGESNSASTAFYSNEAENNINSASTAFYSNEAENNINSDSTTFYSYETEMYIKPKDDLSNINEDKNDNNSNKIKDGDGENVLKDDKDKLYDIIKDENDNYLDKIKDGEGDGENVLKDNEDEDNKKPGRFESSLTYITETAKSLKRRGLNVASKSASYVAEASSKGFSLAKDIYSNLKETCSYYMDSCKKNISKGYNVVTNYWKKKSPESYNCIANFCQKLYEGSISATNYCKSIVYDGCNNIADYSKKKASEAYNYIESLEKNISETYNNIKTSQERFSEIFKKTEKRIERLYTEKQNVYTKKKNPNSTISSYKDFFQTFNDNKLEAIPECEAKKTNDVIKFEETQDENSLFEKFMSFNLKVYKFTEFLGQNYIFASLVAYYLIKRILFVKYLSFSQWFVFFSSLYFHIVSTRLFPISLFV